MRVLHVAYSLGGSSAGTRISEAIGDRCEHFFYLGRISKYPKVKNRQLNAQLSTIIGLTFHVLDYLISRMFRKKPDEIFSFGLFYRIQGTFVQHLIKKHNIDILHIHWGGYSFFPVESMAYINVPIKITAHDYNYFTGGCHVPMFCKKHASNCEKCPLVRENHVSHSLIAFLKKRRERVLFNKKDDLIIIAPSNYTKTIINSIYPFLQVEVIGNPLGEDYENKKLEDSIAQYFSDLKKRDGKLQVLIVSIFNSARDNKGHSTVLHLLKSFNINFELVTVSGSIFDSDKIKVLTNEFCKSESLVDKYVSADLCLVPSKFETFSQVTLEAISVGTPVISFDLTGPKDIITDTKTGFLVTSFNDDDFVATILRELMHKRNNLENIRQEIEDTRVRFSIPEVSDRYYSVYKM
jgi:glycosyltransferase involved in cell wall biosynthesis